SEENGRLKREFRVAPGASFDLIEILYDDGITPSVDDAGILRFASPAGEMLESPLVCWQVIEGEKVSRTATYLVEEGAVRIVVDGYDPEYELVIDPELVYSTYLGGSGGDYGYALAPDGEGGVWVAGQTMSADFPVTDDAYQGSRPGTIATFVSRFSSNGTLLYSTYLGGSSLDLGYALAPDGASGIWVAGGTWSEDFPVTDDAYQDEKPGGELLYDAFVTRFSSAGELIYSTYLGGRSHDFGYALAPDGEDGVWVAGYTSSIDYPVTDDAYQESYGGGYQDAFISRFSSAGVLLYSTYLGGSSGDHGNALAPDGAGGVWVTGVTSSDDFPVTDDAWQGSHGDRGDAFVSRFSSAGALIYSTYLGGSSGDHGYALAPDGSGGVWVTGVTGSDDFPVTDDAYQASHGGGSYDAFVSRFSSAGALLYSTYLGGSGDDEGFALSPDGSGGVWVAGGTGSDDFPVTDDAYQGSYGGGDWDAFVARFSSTGALLYSTYLGGSGNDSGRALAPDGSGGVWVAGTTRSTNFIVTDDAHQGSHGGHPDAFVSRFSMPPAPTAAFTAAPTTGTAPLMVQFTDESTGYPTAWSWEYSTGNPGWTEFSTEKHPEYEFSEAGTYSIRLTVMNAGGEDTRTKDGYITVTDAIPPLPPSDDYEFILKWGSYGTGDGQFWMPRGVTVDSAGNVYVADRNNHRIQKFD
ncbi:MAG: PKD domain-containing protein, partial [Methanocalculus sp. MSAO_Arc2]|uniref:SBBP repeat-containing protein n=1 Tax=Methanocalculus sp. MSAO_Arc2 TaxID=2293855 RepID=UPI000FF2678C